MQVADRKLCWLQTNANFRLACGQLTSRYREIVPGLDQQLKQREY